MSSRKASGFSLIEISIVITIVSVMIASAMAGLRPWMIQMKMDANNKRIDAIQSALNDFVWKYGRLPCAADPGLSRTDANYAKELVNCTAAAGSTVHIAAAGDAARFTRIGAAPTRTLNLPDDYYADSDGHAFIYAVAEFLTVKANVDAVKACQAAAAPNNYYKFSDGTCAAGPGAGLYASADDLGTMNVINEAGAAIVNPANSAVYVLASAGRDGKGAYTKDGKTSVACGLAAGGLDQENCNGDSVFRSTPYGNVAGVNYFDDTIVYGTKMVNATSMDMIAFCNAKNKIYKPGDPGADEDGCLVSGAGAIACPAGQFMTGIQLNGQPNCQAGTISGAGSCPAGQVMKGIQADGTPICQASGGGASVVVTCNLTAGPCTATCPAGYTVTGGGANVTGSYTGVAANQVTAPPWGIPSGTTGWYCSMGGWLGGWWAGNPIFTCYAVCKP